MIEEFEIIIRERATKDRIYREDYKGTLQQAERRASHIWSQPEYCSGAAVDRYQLEMKRPGQKYFMLIR